jgi:ATP-dependent DNA helicase HFM1/MER3
MVVSSYLPFEQLLNKKQASGHKILSAVRELPQYFVTIHELAVAHTTVASGNAIDVEVDIGCSVSLESGSSSKSKGQKSRHYQDMTYILTVTSDLEFIDFRRIPLSRSSRKLFIINLQTFLQY